jgi:predicted naringenin-chalcone synthase
MPIVYKAKTTTMNRNLIIAALVAAGIAAYLFTSRRPKSNNNVTRSNVRTHHLTNAFSKAKQHAVNIE